MKRAILLLLSAFLFFCCVPLFGQSAQGSYRDVYMEEQEALDNINAEIERLGALAGHKKEVRKELNNGNLAGVMRMFQSDSQPMQKDMKDGKYDDALAKLIDLILVYQNIPQLEDQLLFYEGSLYFHYGRMDTARNKLEQLLSEYPSSSFDTEAVIMLEEIYFRQDENSRLVALVEQYPNDMQPKQIFWLANAHYNLDHMEEAETLFSSLVNDPEYGFKATALLSLTSYYNYGVEYAIEKFLTMIIDDPENPDIDFVYLSLGRLYQERGDDLKALYCYQMYMAYTQRDIPDEFLFEMVMINLRMEDYESAMIYLKQLVEDPNAYEYYSSPEYLSALVNYQQGDLEAAQADIGSALDNTSLMVDVLNTKRELIQRYKDLLAQYNQSNTSAGRQATRDKMVELNNEVVNSTGTLEDVGVGLPPADITRLQIYEEEFGLLNDTMEQVRLLIDLANSRPNTKVPAQIDNRVAELADYATEVRTLRYLSNMQEVKMGDYELAYALSSELLKTQQLLAKWRDVQSNGMPAVRDKAQQAINLLQENLTSLETVALYSFGELKTDTELQQSLAAEEESLAAFRNDMLNVRARVVREYNFKVAQRLGQVNLLLLDENQDMRERYAVLLSALEQDINNVSSRFEYTLLDILYDETAQMDEQFQQLQAQYRSESETGGQ